MCKVYINNKNKAEWYSQRWQRECELYNITEISTKEIVILDQIKIEETDIYDIQKEDFPEYNEEAYVSKNDNIIEQKKI